jgi:ppGpp synthetase/RelA/SpoT-type nucleotidyltranferase
VTGFDLEEIDRIGERLRSGGASEADYGVLRQWARTFEPAVAEVVTLLRNAMGVRPSDRPLKSELSIVRKLRERPKMRLSQMRDIAGCRVVVDELAAQRDVIDYVTRTFAGTKVIDHVANPPSSGYRAVHCEIPVSARRVELQVRTTLQDAWARYSELLTYHVHPDIRLGRGPDRWVNELSYYSQKFAEADRSDDVDAARTRRQVAFTFELQMEFVRDQLRRRARMESDQ